MHVSKSGRRKHDIARTIVDHRTSIVDRNHTHLADSGGRVVCTQAQPESEDSATAPGLRLRRDPPPPRLGLHCSLPMSLYS